jgi:plastocyanin
VRLGIILSLFALFFIISVPSAFADDVAIVTVDESGFSQACVDTGCYVPLITTVNIGDTVTMTNSDPTGVHTFTSGFVDEFTPYPTGIFDSGVMMSGDSFEWVPTEAGAVLYYCMLHTWMVGLIEVNPDNSNPTSPPTYFGATIELDQRVYTTVDTVYITIVAPDYNTPNLIDVIGSQPNNRITISTSMDSMDYFTLVETGRDTGIFVGSIILRDEFVTDNNRLLTSSDDEITILFSTSYFDVMGTAMIRWNIGEIQWLETNYSVNESGKIRIIDADLNLNTFRDSVSANVYSDSDPNGIYITLTETGDASGIFEGKVSFTKSRSGMGLFVDGGDAITAVYLDDTLPDPYTPYDELDITAVSSISGSPTLSPPPVNYPPKNYSADITINQGTSVPGCENINNCYSPYRLSVDVGDTVEWYNADSSAHAVTSGSPSRNYVGGEFDSGMLMPGESFSHTFTTSGTFDYFDTIHPWMTGTIQVTGSNTFVPPTPKPIASNTITTVDESGFSQNCVTTGCYTPFTAIVDFGDVVTMKNTDPTGVHTFTSGTVNGFSPSPDGTFDSGVLMSGDAFEWMADVSGQVPYYCMLHTWMTGTVIVQGSEPSSPMPPSQPILQSDVKLKVGNSSYKSGDTIFYSGKVTNAKVGSAITITLTSPNGDLVAVEQLSVGVDGEFRSFFSTGGLLWSSDGLYTIQAQHDSSRDSVQFKFKNPSITPVTPTPIVSEKIDVYTDSNSYSSGSLVSVRTSTASNANVAISVSDSDGNNIVTRTVTVDNSGKGEVQFKLSSSAKSGTYVVDATATVSGKKISDSTKFTVSSNSSGNITIVSLSPTDQQGNPVSSFTKGKLGFVNVVLDSDSSTTSLVTINLFDSQLTSLGIGSFKTTLNSGQSEMSLSFFIPNDAEFGSGDIYANVFSDWPSQGGVPLTGESATKVRLQ